MSEDLPELPAAGEPAAGEPAAADADSWQLPWASQTNWDAHWAADPGAAGWSRERRMLALEFAGAIRKTGSLMQVMSQAAADIIGLNATDLNCLNILSFSGSLTAGELSKATGLTTASITGVVDRLAAAGFVTRERDPNDRRRVVVSLVLEKAVTDVAPVFAPMVADWQELARGYSDDELRLIVRFYDQMEGIIRKHLARLREQQR
jgi:DNA-binding MarR family transcriptional regulator